MRLTNCYHNWLLNTFYNICELQFVRYIIDIRREQRAGVKCSNHMIEYFFIGSIEYFWLVLPNCAKLLPISLVYFPLVLVNGWPGDFLFLVYVIFFVWNMNEHYRSKHSHSRRCEVFWKKSVSLERHTSIPEILSPW